MSLTATPTRPRYNARHDADYIDRVIVDVLSHWGRYRRLQRTVGGTYESVRDAIKVAERLGFEFEADHDHGYRVTGFRRRRYLRADVACLWPLEYPGGGQVPGQLSIDDC